MTGASSNLDLRSRGLGPSTATVRYASAARRRFDWQEGYAVFSVRKSAESDAKTYIENQADHQQQRDYKEYCYPCCACMTEPLTPAISSIELVCHDHVGAPTSCSNCSHLCTFKRARACLTTANKAGGMARRRPHVD